MTENTEIPGRDETPEKTTSGRTWVRVQLPGDAIAQESITAQEIVAAIKEAQQEWVERVIRKGGRENKTAGG